MLIILIILIILTNYIILEELKSLRDIEVITNLIIRPR